MPKKHFPTGLDHRMRDHDGEIRRKRSDTKVETLRETYGAVPCWSAKESTRLTNC